MTFLFTWHIISEPLVNYITCFKFINIFTLKDYFKIVIRECHTTHDLLLYKKISCSIIIIINRNSITTLLSLTAIIAAHCTSSALANRCGERHESGGTCQKIESVLLFPDWRDGTGRGA